jgi:hypothetical protein
MSELKRGVGGRGGDAEVEGDDSSAEGGEGGQAVISDGGRGGDAKVAGNRSVAIGGKGGRGGVGPGQRGGDAIVTQDSVFSVGGQGGEASQADGRGGRGGRAHLAIAAGVQDRGHIKPPYGKPHTEPGRGGDAPDTPQYVARKLIVMALKERYYIEKEIEPRDPDTVWYDRVVVPLDWLNATLDLRGHKWTVSIVDKEYEFTDIRMTL